MSAITYAFQAFFKITEKLTEKALESAAESGVTSGAITAGWLPKAIGAYTEAVVDIKSDATVGDDLGTIIGVIVTLAVPGVLEGLAAGVAIKYGISPATDKLAEMIADDKSHEIMQRRYANLPGQMKPEWFDDRLGLSIPNAPLMFRVPDFGFHLTPPALETGIGPLPFEAPPGDPASRGLAGSGPNNWQSNNGFGGDKSTTAMGSNTADGGQPSLYNPALQNNNSSSIYTPPELSSQPSDPARYEPPTIGVEMPAAPETTPSESISPSIYNAPLANVLNAERDNPSRQS